MRRAVNLVLGLLNLVFTFLVTLKAVELWTKGHIWISMLVMFFLSMYVSLREILPAELRKYRRQSDGANTVL